MRLRLITCSFPGQPQLYTMGIGKLQSAAKLPALLNLCLTVDMMYMEHRVFCRNFYKNSLLMALDGCLMCTEKKMGRFCAINSPVFPQKHTSWHNETSSAEVGHIFSFHMGICQLYPAQMDLSKWAIIGGPYHMTKQFSFTIQV